MWIKGYVIGGLLVVMAVIVASVLGWIWLNVHVFNYLGYQDSLFVDGGQLALVVGGGIYSARREKTNNQEDSNG